MRRAAERQRHVLGARGLVAPLDERVRHPGRVAVGEVRLQRHQRARLLARGDHQRRVVGLRVEDRAHRVADAGRGVQVDERRARRSPARSRRPCRRRPPPGARGRSGSRREVAEHRQLGRARGCRTSSSSRGRGRGRRRPRGRWSPARGLYARRSPRAARSPRRTVTSTDVTVAGRRWCNGARTRCPRPATTPAPPRAARDRAEADEGDEDRPGVAPGRQQLRRSAVDHGLRTARAGGPPARRGGARSARASSRRRASRRSRCGRRSRPTASGKLGDERLAIVFTDLVGFSDWALEAGDDISLELLRAVAEAIEPPVARTGGEVVKRLGDGMMAVFATRRRRRRGVRGPRSPRSRRGRRVPCAYARWNARRLPAAARRRLPRRRREHRRAGRRGASGGEFLVSGEALEDARSRARSRPPQAPLPGQGRAQRRHRLPAEGRSR